MKKRAARFHAQPARPCFGRGSDYIDAMKPMVHARRLFAAVLAAAAVVEVPARGNDAMPEEQPAQTETATFGGGCFWCVEAVFEQIPGVLGVVSGYAGGQTDEPTYEEVCRGNTGHAEVTQVEFDPAVISFEKLLEHFWEAHDPTQLNRQGADVGTQYRSIILYHSEHQRILAEASKTALDASGRLDRPVVTEITAAGKFFPAEKYHQDYYRRNPSAPYSRHVIRDKLEKLGLQP